MSYADPFAESNKLLEQQEKLKVAEQLPYQIEAFQVVRIRKSGVVLERGTNKREIINTFLVQNGQVDIAKERAMSQAKRLGNCMVVMKMEEVIESFGEAKHDESFVYKKCRK